MTAETITENIDGTPQPTQTDGVSEQPKRQRSSIAFPYMDLSEGVALANAVHTNVGTGSCSAEQLAAWIKQSATSSSFRLRLATSRLFGLLDTERTDAIRLTELGRMVVDAKREREARARAFQSVPLFRAIYERFKGGVLPPAAALEREMTALGVASTLTDRARPVLERSAEQAGYFEHGRDRLVMPGFAPAPEDHPDNNRKGNGDIGKGGSGGGSGSGGGGDDGVPRHPLVEGLFQSLPPDGSPWTIEDAADWLQAAAYNLRFAYKLKGQIKVEIVPQRVTGGEA